jgi:putative ABC transport system ATP-binding protein
MFQELNLVQTLAALEAVMLAGEDAGVPGPENRATAREALGLVGLADRAGHRPTELSGGEQQRVAIAHALAQEPELIPADEPAGKLPERTAEILALFRASNRDRGQAVVMVTHDAEVGAACDRVIRMRDGRRTPGNDEAGMVRSAR